MRRMVGKDAFFGLRKAIVKDVAGDKTKCNCLTVEICSNGMILENVPIAVDIASKSFGKVVIPKKGDNVVVGFFDSNFEQPVVLGSFYDPSRKPPIEVDNKNNIACLKTESGLEIKIDDSSDKSGIYIKTKDKHQIEIHESEQYLLFENETNNNKAKLTVKMNLKNGEVEVQCASLKVTAENEITMKSGKNELSINGSSGINIKSPSGKVAIDAQNIEEKAKTGVKVEGTNIKINAKTQLDAVANATANFKSSGNTNLGGTLVKIG